METQTVETKTVENKRKFFSLDTTLEQKTFTFTMKTNIKTLFDTIKRGHEGARPITNRSEAVQAWGLGGLAEDEISLVGKKISAQACGFFVFWMLVALYGAYSYKMCGMGILTCVEFGLVLAAIGSLALVKSWQSYILCNEKYTTFAEYISKGKWLFSLVLVVAYGCMVQTGSVMAAGTIDLPDAEVKLSTDLSSRFIGMIVGSPWGDHGGSVTASGVSSVLIPVLTCLNTGALMFVSVYCVYIYSMGIVQIAHSGSWQDSQIFSTFWSPIRTSAALALCAPMATGISFLHHLILIAIAMSINLANNVSVVFVDQVNETSGLTLSATMGPVVEENFGKILSATQTALTIQYAAMGIYGINLAENKIFSTTETKGNALSGYTITVSFTPPERVYKDSMPSITIKSPTKAIAESYVNATAAMTNILSPAIAGYLSSDVTKRGDFTALSDVMPQAHKAFSETLKNNFAAALAQNKGSNDQQILKNITAQSGVYGWMTTGLYPFIIARQQGLAQGAVKSSVETSQGDFSTAIGDVSSVKTPELNLVTSLYKELGAQLTVMENSGLYSGLTAVGRTRTGGTGAMALYDKVADMIDSTFPETIVKKLKEENVISAMFSFGSTLVDTSSALITTWGAISGGAEGAAKAGNDSAAGILGQIPGVGAAAAKVSGATSGALAGAVTVWSPMILVVLGSVFIFGIACCYVLPLLPIIFWARATLSWAVLVIETLLGAPFWAAAHVLPEGVGFAGQHARTGYLMLLDVFIRPVLLVCGAIMSMLVLQVWGGILAEILGLWATTTNQATGFWLLGVLFTSGAMIYVSYESVKWLYIQGIGVFPEKVIRWCGGQASETGVQGSAQQVQNFAGKLQAFTSGGSGAVVGGAVKKAHAALGKADAVKAPSDFNKG